MEHWSWLKGWLETTRWMTAMVFYQDGLSTDTLQTKTKQLCMQKDCPN